MVGSLENWVSVELRQSYPRGVSSVETYEMFVWVIMLGKKPIRARKKGARIVPPKG